MDSFAALYYLGTKDRKKKKKTCVGVSTNIVIFLNSLNLRLDTENWC